MKKGILSSSPSNATNHLGGPLNATNHLGGNPSSSPLNATSRLRDVSSSTEEAVTKVANNSAERATIKSMEARLPRTTGSSARTSNRNVQTTKAAPFQPTRPPAVMVKPGRCPVVGFLVPHHRHPPLGPLPRWRFSSSSSEESRWYWREYFGRYHHSYGHHGLQQRPDPCRAPDCRVDGNCLGELKCCAISGCGMRCLRPVPSDQLPGDMHRFQP